MVTVATLPTPARGRASDIARIRERFATRRSDDLTGVRPLVARSWARSRAAGVDPGVDRGYFEEGRVDEPTVAIAEPHLRRLDELAGDVGGYVSLTAPNGAIVMPSYLSRESDFPEGYSLNEASCGSNGEGVALEEGRGVWLAPEEHFREDMRGNWCFASLIRDPLHHRVRGVVGLTIPAAKARNVDPGPTLLMLEGVTSRIEHEIDARMSTRERTLLREYLTVSRRRGIAAVFATDGKHAIMNSAAVSTFAGGDLTVIAGYANGVMASGAGTSVEVMLSGIGDSQVEVSPVALSSTDFGAVVVVRPRSKGRGTALDSPGSRTPQSARVSEGPQVTAKLDVAARLHGESVAFRRTVESAQAALEAGRCMVILGEPGTGKRRLGQLLAGAHEQVVEVDVRAGGGFEARVHEAVDRRAAVLLLHADELSVPQSRVLTGHLRAESHPVVICTAESVTEATQVIRDACAAVEIPVAPLRRRREDIAVLADAIVAEAGARRLSRRLSAALCNGDWPGNIAQLRQVVLDAADRSRGIEVTEQDLTPGLHRVLTGGRLSRLEDVELAEIRGALREAAGNRRLAAEILEIGRSTLYRRMDYFRSRGFAL